MKNLIFCAGILCLIIFFPQNNYAQLFDASVKSQNEFNYGSGNSTFESNVRLNEINTRAFRHFLKNYPKAENEKWFINPKGSCAVFESDSVLNKIFYNKKGVFVLAIKYYNESGLNEILKNIVHTFFPAYATKTVVELYDGRLTSYEICVVNNEQTKMFEVNNNEISNVRELKN